MEKEIKVAVVGNAEMGKAVAHAIANKHNVDVIVVDEPTPHITPNVVDINGELYAAKPSKGAKNTPHMSRLMTAAAMMHAPHVHELLEPFGNNYKRQLPPHINIVHEYALIKQKKSELTKWQRDAVVHIFERKYAKVFPIKHK
jgi:hypothetical protein